jgi:hypothetical protein
MPTKDRPTRSIRDQRRSVAAALVELGFVTEIVAVDLDPNHFMR